MAEAPTDESREVVCPHCKKNFEPEFLRGVANRHRGFKCPHCRLFVASDRANDAAADGS
jgi:DNA-directed RNA polymerase subunit RPC12/RpoP